jgi:SAM-dependent methyltransferase
MIFNYKGKLIRPAQYSIDGQNGERVILYEIEKLNASEYIEKPFQIIGKEQLPFLRNCHTFNYCNELLIMDYCGQRETDKEYKKLKKGIFADIRQKNFYPDHELLKKVFKLNTSGNGLCYYGATISGDRYEGERDFDTRWELIKDCMDFTGMNVLDIGCNMGILLCYLKAFAGIDKGLGIDQPDEMLIESSKPDTIKAAILLRQAFGIDDSEIGFMQTNINYAGLWETLNPYYDLVVAMSIYKWIDDKEGFMRYLSGFKNILYEGHEPDDVEIERFAKYGFSAKILGKTQTGVHYSSDNFRTLILFEK